MMKSIDPKWNSVFKILLHWGAVACVAVGILAFFSFDISSSEFSIFIIVTNGNSLLNTVALVGICWLLNKIEKLIIPSGVCFFQTIIQGALSAFFSFFSLLSVYFDANLSESIITVLKSPISLISFSVAFCGGMLFFFVVIRLIWHMGGCFVKIKSSNSGLFTRFFENHLYRNCILVMSVCWIPQYIIRFPGVVPYDTWQSLAMHLGYTQTTTQHPLIWGSLVGNLTELGMSIGINWLAPLVICLVQHIMAMFVVSYTIATIKKLGFPNWFLFGVLAFFVILPPMSLYASTVYNDFIYSLAIMLLTIELVYYLYDRKAYFSEIRHWIFTALAVFGTITRYNGLYTMLGVILAIAVREIYLLIKRNAKFVQTVAIILIFMIVPLLCGQVIQNSLNQKYNAKEITSRAMLAMPIQQSVCCLIVYGDEIPQKEYDAIHTVLTWSDEEYSQTYDPRNFDSVKESFKTDATKKEMSAFLKAWIKLVLKYPKTCFMATANQTYYLFSPRVQNVRYYESISAHADLALERYGFDTSTFVLESSVLKILCRALYGFQKVVFPMIPIIGLIVNQAVYTILLFSICLCALFRKDGRPLVLTVALLITLGITFLGPAVYNHPRYVYPIMFCMPILIAAFMLSKSKNESSLTEANV